MAQEPKNHILAMGSSIEGPKLGQMVAKVDTLVKQYRLSVSALVARPLRLPWVKKETKKGLKGGQKTKITPKGGPKGRNKCLHM